MICHDGISQKRPLNSTGMLYYVGWSQVDRFHFLFGYVTDCLPNLPNPPNLPIAPNAPHVPNLPNAPNAEHALQQTNA